MECKFLPGDLVVCIQVVENPQKGPCPVQVRGIYTVREVRVQYPSGRPYAYPCLKLKEVKRWSYPHFWFEKLVDASIAQAMAVESLSDELDYLKEKETAV